MKTLTALLLLAFVVGCVCPEEELLIDFDLFWTNPYNAPIDQLSVQDNLTGQIFVANLVCQPYLYPNKSGLFVITMQSQDYQDITHNGFKVMSARIR